MKPGDVTEAMRTPKGYQLLKLESMTPPKVLTAEEAHDKIADRLFEQKRVAETKKYLAKLRSQAIIEWKNDELRKAYESVPKDEPTDPAGVRAAGRRAQATTADPVDDDRDPAPDGPQLRAEHWYAVWTRSRHERAVFEQLTERQHRGVPADRRPVEPLEGPQEAGRLAAVSRVLLRPIRPGRPAERPEVQRGRLDGRASTASPRRFRTRRSTRVRTLVDSTLPYDPCPLIKAGSRVEVVHGPLKGVVGRLERKGGHARLVLAVDLIGRAVSVQVDAADVRELTPSLSVSFGLVWLARPQTAGAATRTGPRPRPSNPNHA